ncbi:MAG: heat shock protein transcriptional repressor HspR [Dehalococcoidia bacterium]
MATLHEPVSGNEPCYVISVAARMVGVHAQTLRSYERLGLVSPSRSRGNVRLYSQREIERIRRIKGLMEELGVNLAGAEVVVKLLQRMAEMQQEMEHLTEQVRRLREDRRSQRQDA